MRFCTNCGNPVEREQNFCAACGSPLSENSSANGHLLIEQEQKFLDTTHKILRWEYKAWKICGVILTVLGCVLTALFLAVAVYAFVNTGRKWSLGLMLTGIAFAVYYGIPLLVVGVIQRKIAKKIPNCLNTMHLDFSVARMRCGSVGGLILAAIFCGIAFVFYGINFVRMKANKSIIERILERQKGTADSV